eukprot:CAMPEP_0184015010 /NCGR_PEP_ID=MMETSP0954-20121128/6048_1 /TAXON_ID=627963 /ORGANISM="Aplanochytrium sp, Strain PBS07" /LENGTH=46 /DNA_ID= /DNA_START= /DNA_END= /DNA_ORIENTATION=
MGQVDVEAASAKASSDDVPTSITVEDPNDPETTASELEQAEAKAKA